MASLGKVKVVVSAGLREELLEQVRAVSPRLEVVGAYALFRADRHRLSARDGQGEDLENLSPELRALLAEAEVLLVDRFPVSLLGLCPRLRWAQLSTVGADAVQGGKAQELPIAITVARGVPSVPIAEFAIMAMLVLAKQALTIIANQRERRWARLRDGMEVWGKTLAVVGLGSIGTEVARRARALGMRVLATRRSVTEWIRSEGDADELFPPGQLRQMLSQADFVVIAAPLTEETRGMIGEAELRAMKPTAYLINVTRGEIIDEAALLRALREGWLAGAALDVFAQEPLPAEHPFWGLPNLLVSPHTSGTSERRDERLAELFAENLRRYLAGEPLLSVVGAAGY